MSAANKIARKAIRLANRIVDVSVLISIMSLVVVGSYAMWDSKQVYQTADTKRYEIYKPTAEASGGSFEELQEINPEVFAWLTVYGTNIDHPVVQGPDNMKYVNTNAEGQYSLSGAIFLDNRSSKDFSDFSSIVYGHHMEKSAMFGNIGAFADKQYFEARRYGMIYYGGREHGLEFFSFLQTDAYNDAIYRAGIEGQEDQQAYIELLSQAALHTRGIRITTDDRIVLLSTCSANSTNGRDILLGRVTDEIYADPFETTETDNGALAFVVDELSGLWEQAPLWTKSAVIGTPAIVMASLLFLINDKKKKRRKRNAMI